MLRKTINNYVELHRAMGFKFRIQNCLLQNFLAFAEQRGDIHVRKKTVLEWAELAPSPAQRRNRLLTVRRFAIAVKAEDKYHQIPPADAFGHATFKQRKPYILSDDELKLLLTAALTLKPENTIRPRTYATLFALIAATGLRIGEALALNIKDLTEDGLIIHATKFHKDRIVPLHETTRQGLKCYLNYRIKYSGLNPSLFISNKGTSLSYSTVISIFIQIVQSAGLRDGPGNPGVCIHDLRHRFAVRSLEQCSGKNRDEISRHILALSTYLGHAHISDTYWYLHSTPILMAQIAEAQEIFYRRKRK